MSIGIKTYRHQYEFDDWVTEMWLDWMYADTHVAHALFTYMQACGKPQSLYVLISIFHFTPFTENSINVYVCP